MAHLTDRQLQEHVQGVLPAEEGAACAAHLGGCGECQGRLAALEGVWGPLGSWGVPGAPGALKGQILAALPAARAEKAGAWWRRSMRVAAGLLVAAGIGHGAGRLMWKPAAMAPADADAAVMALHLDDLPTATLLLAALEAPEGVEP